MVLPTTRPWVVSQLISQLPPSNLPQHQAEAEAQHAAHLGHLGTRGDQGPQQGAAEDRHEELGLRRQDLGSHWDADDIPKNLW